MKKIFLVALAIFAAANFSYSQILIHNMEGTYTGDASIGNWNGYYYGSLTGGTAAYSASVYHSGTQSLALQGNFTNSGTDIIGSYVISSTGENWASAGNPSKISFWVKSSASTTALVKIGIQETYGPGANDYEQWDLRSSVSYSPTTTWTQYSYELNETNFERVYSPGSGGNNTLDLTNITNVRFIVIKNTESSNSTLSVYFDDAYRGRRDFNLLNDMEGTMTNGSSEGNWDSYGGDLASKSIGFSSAEKKVGTKSLQLWGDFSASGTNIIGSYIKSASGENWTATSKIQFWVKSSSAPSGATMKIGIEEIDGSNAGTEQWDLKNAFAITPTTTWTQYTFDLNTTNFEMVYSTGTHNGTLDLTQVTRVRFVVLKNGETNSSLSVYCDEAFNGGIALPVELTLFTAASERNAVLLHWNTATEINNYGFEIEKSKMGEGRSEMWEKIGFVEGNGTTNAPKSYSFTDKSAPGKTSYRLKQIDRDGKFEYSQEVEVIALSTPKEFALGQNYPNPFNPTTTIGYQLPANGRTTLKIYDAIGREVATLVSEVKEAGYYSVQFDGAHLASGIYLYRLNAEGKSAVRKMHLVK